MGAFADLRMFRRKSIVRVRSIPLGRAGRVSMMGLVADWSKALGRRHRRRRRGYDKRRRRRVDRTEMKCRLEIQTRNTISDYKAINWQKDIHWLNNRTAQVRSHNTIDVQLSFSMWVGTKRSWVVSQFTTFLKALEAHFKRKIVSYMSKPSCCHTHQTSSLHIPSSSIHTLIQSSPQPIT